MCDADCNVCGATRTAAEHSWNEGAITKESTKKEEGIIEYTCTVCHETKTESIAKRSGCGGGEGVSAAFVSCGGISSLWFVLKRRFLHR